MDEPWGYALSPNPTVVQMHLTVSRSIQDLADFEDRVTAVRGALAILGWSTDAVDFQIAGKRAPE